MQKEAEAAARDLLAVRTFPPAPDKSVLARAKGALKAAAAKAKRPDAVTESAETVRAQAPAGMPVPEPTPGVGRKMQVQRSFGVGSLGLSVTASSFTAKSAAEADASGLSSDADAAPVVMGPGDSGLLDAAFNQLARAHHITRLSAADVQQQQQPPMSAGRRLGESLAVTISCLAFKGHASGAAVTCMSVDHSDGRVATGGNGAFVVVSTLYSAYYYFSAADGHVVLWDMASRSYVYAYEDHTAAITSVKVVRRLLIFYFI
jgi:hypothetical protein